MAHAGYFENWHVANMSAGGPPVKATEWLWATRTPSIKWLIYMEFNFGAGIYVACHR